MPKAADVSILLVDDQPSMRSLARFALESFGMRSVVEAKSGREAIQLMEGKAFSLIISDWNMEDVDGLTFLKVVRKHPRTKSTPFIMLTGHSDREQVKQAIDAGVNNYVIKPFDAMTLLKKIEAVIGKIE